MGVTLRALVVAAWLLGSVAHAGARGAPSTSAPAPPLAATSAALRDANAAALAGDWPRVAQLVDPLFIRPLPPADLGEAHRLAGIAALFQRRTGAAEQHVLAYFRIDPDGRLDPALYPPDAVAFFNDVASRHAAELRALRSPPRRSWWLTVLPPLAQIQNGEPTKAWIVGGALGGFLVTNVTSYFLLRAWCDRTSGPGGGGLNCGEHRSAAAIARPVNVISAIAAIATYGYGVYDGIVGYRRRSREMAVQPAMLSLDPSTGAADPAARVFGIAGRF